MNRYFLVFAAVLFSLSTFAGSSFKFVEISADHHVAFDSEIFDPAATTLVLLPGIFRGLQREDVFVQKLISKKINFVAVHFSTQPASVGTYPPSGSAFFRGAPELSSQVFADEVTAVVRALKIRKPLVVTLSYSASVSQYLNPRLFPVVVETAPLGRFDENGPESFEMFRFWKQWMSWFPIWGNIIAEATEKNLRESAYRSYWGRVAQQYASKDPNLSGSPVATARLTDGYTTMAKMVEKFDLRTQKFVGTPYRIFILGENEEPDLRAIQEEAVRVYQEKVNPASKALIIPGAGHVVPNDQPDLYVRVLEGIIKKLSTLID